ncbi:MAG: tail fiber domain-containing protein, partial [Thiohalospira sp.]
TNTTEGNSNVFLGFQTGYSNILGRDNVFIGNRSGFKWEGGYDNIFIGNFAGEKSTGGTHSILIGSEAGKNMTGDDNISIGDRSGMNAYVENYETFGTAIVGIDAGRNITGDYTTIFGTGAGSSWGGQSAGNYNVFIGSSAGGGGYTSKLGDYNVCIGYEAGFGADGSHKLFIANNSTSPLIYGEFDNELVRIYGDLQVTGTVEADYGSPSDISLKTNLVTINSGLDMIQSLIPYYFDWTDEAISNYNFKNRKQIGLIAQDVEKVLPELVSESANGYKTVDYIKLTPVLVEAIKEQQQKIEKLEKENTELLKRLDRIEEMLSK